MFFIYFFPKIQVCGAREIWLVNTTHSLLAKEDAEQIAIPHIVLASNGENVEVVAHYKSILEGEGKPNVVSIHRFPLRY